MFLEQITSFVIARSFIGTILGPITPCRKKFIKKYCRAYSARSPTPNVQIPNSIKQNMSTTNQKELQLITPGVNAFLQASRQMTTALVDNVKDFKAIGQEKDDVMCDILNFKVVSRGATNDNLKAFAATNAFSLYAQQYNRKKLPLLTIAPIMEMMVMLHNHFHVDNVEALEDNPREDLVKAFQFYLVQEAKAYEEDHSMDVDFEEAWRDAGLSRSRLFKDPLYYHAQWMVFFNNEFKTIAPLISDYDSALDYHTRMTTITNKLGAANVKTQDLVQVSANIQLADHQVDDAEMYSEAQKRNANQLVGEIDQAGKSVGSTVVSRPDVITLVKLLAEVEVTCAAKPKPRRRVKKVAKKAMLSSDSDSDSSPPPPVVRGGGKGAYYAAAFAAKGKWGGKRPREESSDSDSDSYQIAQTKTRKRSRQVVDSDDEDSDAEDPSAFLGNCLDGFEGEIVSPVC